MGRALEARGDEVGTRKRRGKKSGWGPRSREGDASGEKPASVFKREIV